jgi:hypothetical protein
MQRGAGVGLAELTICAARRASGRNTRKFGAVLQRVRRIQLLHQRSRAPRDITDMPGTARPRAYAIIEQE